MPELDGEEDFLDEMIRKSTERNPEFPTLLEEGCARDKLARELIARRKKKKISQKVVAARMGLRVSDVSKLEHGMHVQVATLQRYCAAIGQRLVLGIEEARSATNAEDAERAKTGKRKPGVRFLAKAEVHRKRARNGARTAAAK